MDVLDKVSLASDVADVIRGVKGPVQIIGGGTRPVGNATGAILDMSGLKGITLYEPGAMTMVAKAGTPLTEIETALAAESQRLAFEPGDWRGVLGTSGNSTIGGIAATNASGPRRLQVGAARDHMLGVEFVDGTGQVLKNGGRVMKNVTGYDLVKLMCGSWGTLGVLTELSFKVAAMPETETTLYCDGLNASEAVAKLCAVMGTPFDISGAAHIAVGGANRTAVRIEGLAASVAYRKDALLEDICAGFEVADTDHSAEIWGDVRNVSPFVGKAGSVWRVSVKPTDAPAVADALDAQVIYDWSGGLMWLLAPEGTDVRSAVAAVGGHATLFRGADDVPAFQPQPRAVAALEAGVRAKFDPRGILNPGRMD